jgi:hypothetical protein
MLRKVLVVSKLFLGRQRLIHQTLRTSASFHSSVGWERILVMAKGALILAQLCILALIAPGLPSVSSLVHAPSVNASQVKTTASGLLPGDVDGDGVVGPKDLATIAVAYGSHPGLPLWDSRADIDGDGAVGLRDLVALVKDYGKITWRAYGFEEPFDWSATGGTWNVINGSLDGFSSSES